MTTQDEDVVRTLTDARTALSRCMGERHNLRAQVTQLTGRVDTGPGWRKAYDARMVELGAQVAILTDIVRDVAVVDWMDKAALENLAERADAALAQQPEHKSRFVHANLANEPKRCPTCNRVESIHRGKDANFKCMDPWHAEVTTLCTLCAKPVDDHESVAHIAQFAGHHHTEEETR